MADAPDDRPPGEPPAPAPTKGKPKAGRAFGRRGAAAPPVKLSGATPDVAAPAGRRRIRPLTLGLGAAGVAALTAYAAHQQSQRRACEAEIQAAIQAGQPAPNCRSASHGSGGTHYSSWHWFSGGSSGSSASTSHTSAPASASTHGFSFGGFGGHGSAHGGGS